MKILYSKFLPADANRKNAHSSKPSGENKKGLKMAK